MPITHTESAWCPWCRRWINPEQHVGPGWHCPACRSHLGTEIKTVLKTRPGNLHLPPVDVANQVQYGLGIFIHQSTTIDPLSPLPA